MSRECKLTTFDNPYDPFDVDEFTPWLLYDNEHGYNCPGRLMRIAQISDDMTQKEIDEEIERAIDEIILYDDANIYKKLIRTVDDEE